LENRIVEINETTGIENMSRPILEVKHLTKYYADVNAVDDISFEVAKGEIVALLGPNGAGKTTTIRCITSLSEPDSTNSVIFDGIDLQDNIAKVRHMIGVCPQELNLYKECTVMENLQLQGYLSGRDKEDVAVDAKKLIKIIGLEEKIDTFAKNLSGGMKRKLQIGRALISSPKIIFLDEPTVGLSPEARIDIWEYIRSLKQQGISIFLTTHYMEEADTLADRVLIMDNGKIIASGDPEDLKDRYTGKNQVQLRSSEIEEVTRLLENEDYDFKQVNPELILIQGLNGRFPDLFKLLEGRDIKELTIKKPSLEDVFLEITGTAFEDREDQQMEVIA